MKEWQELKVLWNLLTGDQRVLENTKDRELLPYSMNAAICNLIVRVRLQGIRDAKILSATEMTALESLFETMSSHYFQKHSGSTCYLLSARGGQVVDGRDTIEKQTQLLRKHYREGTLNKELVAKVEEAIAAKLQILDILNEEDAGLVSEEDIRNRALVWRNQGKADSTQLDYQRRTQIINEILAEKETSLPLAAKKERKESWAQHKSRLTRAIIDLGKYTPDDGAETTIRKALKGKGIPIAAMAAYLRDPGNSERPALVEVYAEQAGRKAIPLLKTLMQDEQIDVSGYEVGSEMVCSISFPVRTAAASALAGMRIKIPGYEDVRNWQHTDNKSYKSNTSEGKAVIKKLLRSNNLKTLDYAIWPAGKSRDTTMIPLLATIANQHKELHDNIVRALGDIGHEDAMPLLLELATAGTVESHTVFAAVADIGGDAAANFLETQMLESLSTSAQMSAVHMLSLTKGKESIPILLKAIGQVDKPFLRVYAARYLQNMGNHDVAVPVAMELITSADEAVRDSAFHILESAKDEPSARLLQRLAKNSQYQNKAIESLIGRGGQIAADTFRTVMESGTKEQKEIVVFQCVNTDFPAVEDLLIEALNSPLKDIRSKAIYALSRRGADKSIPVLRKLIATEPDFEKSIRETLRDIVKNQSKERCDEIMGRSEASQNHALSARDLFALLVVQKHDQFGPKSDARRKFADSIVNHDDQRMIDPIIMYFSEYAHDSYQWNFLTSECQSMMETLDKFPEKSIAKILAFVADTTKMNRELGLGFLAGRGRYRTPYALENIPGLEKLLNDCTNDNDASLSAEAKRLQHMLKTVPEDRVFAVALYDLKIPRDRGHALDNLRYEHLMKLSMDQKEQAVPPLLAVLNEIENEDPMGHLWGAIEAAGRLQDKRLAPPLKRLVEKYDPNDTDNRRPDRIRDAVEVLKSLGYEVTFQPDGRYRVN